LGHPSVVETFKLPPAGGSRTQVLDLPGERVVRVLLDHRDVDTACCNCSTASISPKVSAASSSLTPVVVANATLPSQSIFCGPPAAHVQAFAANGSVSPAPGIVAPPPPSPVHTPLQVMATPLVTSSIPGVAASAGPPPAPCTTVPELQASATLSGATVSAPASAASPPTANRTATAEVQFHRRRRPPPVQLQQGMRRERAWGPRSNSCIVSSDGDEAAGPGCAAEPATPRSPGSHRPWARGSQSALRRSVRVGFTATSSTIQESTGSFPQLALDRVTRRPDSESDSGCCSAGASPSSRSPCSSPCGEDGNIEEWPPAHLSKRFSPRTMSPASSAGGGCSSDPAPPNLLPWTMEAHTKRTFMPPATDNSDKDAEHTPRLSLLQRRCFSLCFPGSAVEMQEAAPLCHPEGSASNIQQRQVKKKGRSRHMDLYMSNVVSAPELRQPAVLVYASAEDISARGTKQNSEESLPPIPRLRPLPGAFSNRRTLIFFDWDDTLCPTSWIRCLLKEKLADMEAWVPEIEPRCPEMDWRDAIPGWFHQPLPDEPTIHEAIAELQQAVINTINVAQAIGVVCIVTNAVPGWVEKTICRWLPDLKQYVCGHGARPPIKVLYGQRAYSQTQISQGLHWVGGVGEYMWWKQAAMTLALEGIEDLYRLGADTAGAGKKDCQETFSWCTSMEAKSVSNIISVGDNEAEMQSAELVGYSCDRWRHEKCGLAPNTSKIRRKFRLKQRVSSGSDESSTSARGQVLDSTEMLTSPTRLLRQSAAERPKCQQRRGHSVTATPLEDAHKPWVKMMKFQECSHVRTLCRQLERVADLLPQVVSLRHHVRLDIGWDDPLSPASTSSKEMNKLLGCSQEDLDLERSLRVQTV